MIDYAYPTTALDQETLLMEALTHRRSIGKSRMVAAQLAFEQLRKYGPRPNRRTRRSRHFTT